MVFAAIDIGSNAVRLLVSNVYEDGRKTYFNKFSLTRVPIRLGEDAFLNGKISLEKVIALVKAMTAFKHLMEIYRPIEYLAYATSAMRNAKNAQNIVGEIEKHTGIKVSIIDGQKEAEIIYSTHVADEMTKSLSYLYIEVGGGSIELSLFSRVKNIFSRSFPIGTVRMLHNLVRKSEWQEIKHWLQVNTAEYHPLVAIGTGGNINCILKMLRKKEGRPFSVKKVLEMHEFLSSYSLDDRIKILGLRPDRADVILPALEIYLSIMKWTDISKIIVPKIGLADGMIHLLYEKYKLSKKAGER